MLGSIAVVYCTLQAICNNKVNRGNINLNYKLGISKHTLDLEIPPVLSDWKAIRIVCILTKLSSMVTPPHLCM